MYGKKVTLYDHKFVSENSGKVFTSKNDVSKSMADRKFNTTGSPDAKLIFDFSDEMLFDAHLRGKGVRHRKIFKNVSNKKDIRSSG